MIVKLLFASVVTGFVGCSGENVTLQWPTDSPTPCIQIQSITNNTLTWNNNGNIVSAGFWSFIGSQVINGSCDGPVFLKLQWDVNNATFQFRFIKEKNNTVTMNMLLEFIPGIVFGKAGNNGTDPVIMSASMPTGLVNHSYECNQETSYPVKVGAYNLNLNFMYLKIQGFGMKDGKWSEGVTYTVTLVVFSGLENPKWIIDSKHPMYSRIACALNNEPSTKLPSGLGYKGFHVQVNNFSGQGIYKTIAWRSNKLVEMLLLESCRNISILPPCIFDILPPSLFNDVRWFINEQETQKDTSESEDDGAVAITPQIVNYATKTQSNTSAHPERASEQLSKETTACNMSAAAVCDGLTHVFGSDDGNVCPIPLN